jgi:hypothetical protein
VETWDTIKYALSNNSHGSVIITTTRIHDVAKACCSLYPNGWVYQPKPLQEQDSKRLFQNRIFGLGNKCPENLKEVSDKILKKCGGLPLETDVYTDNYHECFFFVVILYRFDRLENVHSTHIKYQPLDMDKIP